MPGPNSAPNGDRRLVAGYLYAEYVWVTVNYPHLGIKTRYQISLREALLRKNRLVTGKTSGH